MEKSNPPPSTGKFSTWNVLKGHNQNKQDAKSTTQTMKQFICNTIKKIFTWWIQYQCARELSSLEEILSFPRKDL